MSATADQMFAISAKTEGKANQDRNFARIGETFELTRETSDTIVVTCDSTGTIGAWTSATFDTTAAAVRQGDNVQTPERRDEMIGSCGASCVAGQAFVPVLFFSRKEFLSAYRDGLDRNVCPTL